MCKKLFSKERRLNFVKKNYIVSLIIFIFHASGKIYVVFLLTFSNDHFYFTFYKEF